MAVGAGLALAIALVGWRLSAPTPEAPAPTAAVPALPLKLPEQPSAPSSEASAPAAPQMPARAAPGASGIGAEGFGPHIERAHAGSDPRAAWEAVRWLRHCETNAARRQSFETMRNQGVSPEMMTQLMVEADAEARLCQTITDRHRALLPELAARAMRAGVPEAASAYAAAAFPADLNATQRREVADAMRRDALAGDPQSMINAATSATAWGLSDAERLTFLMAYVAQTEQPEGRNVAENLMKQGAVPFSRPPTREEIAAAGQAAKDLLARRAARRP